MFQQERQNAIYALLEREGRATVTHLAKHFNVSEDCIRKDLRALAARQRCQRVYGGAIRQNILPERNISRRRATFIEEKHVVAKKAYQLIQDTDVIFLDIATTSLALAELLSQGTKHCTVISNMIDALQILAANPALTVLGTGGIVNLKLNGFVGAATLDAIAPLRFDKAFIGMVGCELDGGAVTTFDIEDGLVKRSVIERSRTSYLIGDTHKFSQSGNYEFARVDEFTAIITSYVDDDMQSAAAASGVKIQ